MKKHLLFFLPALFLGAAAQGQFLTAFAGSAGANIGDALNWSNGLPSAGNPGSLAIDANWGPGSAGTLVGYVVTQTAGTLSNSNNRNMSDGTVWTIQGGGINMTGTAQIIIGSSSASTVNVQGGFLNTGGNLQTRNGADLNISAGSVSVGANFNIQTGSSVLLAGGEVSVTSNLAMQEGTLTFAPGNGTLAAAGLSTTGSSVIDFLPGSDGSITIAGFGASEYETLWNGGNLLFGGSNAGTFAGNFIVTGSTLTAIPEPSTYTALFGLGVLGLALLRRRRTA